MGQRADSAGLWGRGPGLVHMDVKIQVLLHDQSGRRGRGRMSLQRQKVDSGTFPHFNTWMHTMSLDPGVNE